MGLRWSARVALATGLLAMLAARLVFPGAPPLYDGVVQIDPYRWLDPPPGQSGAPEGATANIVVRTGSSPLVAVATSESVPQAQIFAQPGSLTLPTGTTTIEVAITPVKPKATPTDGHIDGNVYRFLVTDGRGTPLTAPASARVSIVLRATNPTTADATIERYAAGAWARLDTGSSGFGGTFIAVVVSFGDFAIVLPGSATQTSARPAGSAEASEGASAAVVPSAGQAPEPSLLPGSPDPSSGGFGWLLPGLGTVVIALIVLAYLARRRARREPYRGAREIRRR